MIIRRTSKRTLSSELNRQNQMLKERTKQLAFSTGGLILSLVLFAIGNGTAVFALTTIGILGAVASFICICVYGSKWRQQKTEVDIVQSGVSGESSALHVLSELPDTYTGVPNPRIRYGGHQNEMDLVIIGPNGVFIVETKNHKGDITGRDTDQRLIQVKTSRGGSTYEKEFYNPVKQVGTHVFTLSGFLRQSEEDVWVQGIVYFANPSAKVNVTPVKGEVPVFAASQNGAEKMLAYIQNYDSPLRRPLSQQTIDRIAKKIQ